MGQLPSQRQLIKALVRGTEELGGLQANVLRLFTDYGSGVKPNQSLGRPVDPAKPTAISAVPDTHRIWEVDRVVPDNGTVTLDEPPSAGDGRKLTWDQCSISVLDGDGVKAAESVGAVVAGVETGPSVAVLPADGRAALVTVQISAPSEPPGLWEGTIVFTPNTGTTTERFAVMFWTGL